MAPVLVARGLRILQDFAGICRGKWLICCVFSGRGRFPKPLVGGSTPPGASTLIPLKAQLRQRMPRPSKCLLRAYALLVSGSCARLFDLPTFLNGSLVSVSHYFIPIGVPSREGYQPALRSSARIRAGLSCFPLGGFADFRIEIHRS